MKKYIIIIFICTYLMGCATTYISTEEPSKLTGYTQPYTIWSINAFPLNTTIDAAEVCPGKKIGGIKSIHPSNSGYWLNYFICAFTLTLACPRDVGIECVD